MPENHTSSVQDKTLDPCWITQLKAEQLWICVKITATAKETKVKTYRQNFHVTFELLLNVLLWFKLKTDLIIQYFKEIPEPHRWSSDNNTSGCQEKLKLHWDLPTRKWCLEEALRTYVRQENWKCSEETYCQRAFLSEKLHVHMENLPVLSGSQWRIFQ